MQYRLPNANLRRGFTILEVMMSISLLVIILVITAALIDNSSRIIRHNNASIDAFQSAQQVFESMTLQISQATLNTYWDYYDATQTPFRLTASSTNFIPAYYGRYSDLHFICGKTVDLLTDLPQHLTLTAGHALFFTAPRGVTTNSNYKKLSGLMSACGYFVAFGSDESTRPNIINSPPTYRWRLMELQVPAESLQVFNNSAASNDWFTNAVATSHAHPMADNIIALIIWPRRAPQDDPDGTTLTSNYHYDSRTTAAWSNNRQPVQVAQLPPIVQVAMVAIDEVSAKRMEQNITSPTVISTALSGLFEGSVTTYANDMKTLEQRLNESRIGYHIFNTSINLKESKWSE
jgi:uncharacterized protein (TIGR02599 family)